MELYIVRHGETIGNLNHILQGQLPGELTPLGFEQAHKLGLRLQNEEFQAIYCSDLNRCVQTLSQITQFRSEPQPVFDPRLREKSAGEFEGQPVGTPERAARAQGIAPAKFRPKGGENFADVRARAAAFFQELRQTYLRSGAKVLVVSHAGWIAQFFSVVLGQARQIPKSKNTALTILRVENRSVRVVLANDTSHLS